MEPNYVSVSPITPPFTLRQLSYLVAAAEAGTIVGAAEHMHISASAMSDAITELERLVGTRLCVRRKSQGFTLTSAGVRAEAVARVLLRDAHELYNALHADSDELVGPLAVGCFPTLAPTVLPPLLSDFGNAHPRLDIEVIEADQDNLVKLLDSGRIDLAFVYDADLPRHSHRVTLFELPPHVLLSARHPLAGEPFVQLDQLIDEDFIMLDAPPSSENTLATFASQGLSPRIRHRTANPEVVRTLVGRELGYGMLIQRHIDYTSDTGFPVVMKNISPAIPPVAIEVIWSADLEPSRRTQSAIDFAKSVEWPTAPLMPSGNRLS